MRRIKKEKCQHRKLQKQKRITKAECKGKEQKRKYKERNEEMIYERREWIKKNIQNTDIKEKNPCIQLNPWRSVKSYGELKQTQTAHQQYFIYSYYYVLKHLYLQITKLKRHSMLTKRVSGKLRKNKANRWMKKYRNRQEPAWRKKRRDWNLRSTKRTPEEKRMPEERKKVWNLQSMRRPPGWDRSLPEERKRND